MKSVLKEIWLRNLFLMYIYYIISFLTLIILNII